MAKLTRQLDGSYLTLDNKNVGNLDAAYSRGTPEDIANVNYARDKYGYTPQTEAGGNFGLSNESNLPSTNSLVPAGVQEPTEEADIFNLLTRDALLKFQGVNTADLEKKKRALQMAALNRGSEVTPEDLRTFSPEQQAAIRSGNISVLQPEFDDVAYQLNKAQQATINFENVYEKVMKISEDYAAKMVAPDSVIANYKKLIEADPENINTYLSKVNDKTRDAILQALDYEKLKPKEETKKPTISEQLAAAEKGYIIDENGNIVKKNSSKFSIGGYGDECGVFMRNIYDDVRFGDSWEEKMSQSNVNTNVSVKDKFKVGDIVIQKTRMPYGHVSSVIGVNGDEITLLESNWNNDKKIGERIIKANDPTITGAVRGKSFNQEFIDSMGENPSENSSGDDIDYVLNDVIPANLNMTSSEFKLSLEKEVSAGNLSLTKSQITSLVSNFKEQKSAIDKEEKNKTEQENKVTALTDKQKEDVAIKLLKATKMDKEIAKQNVSRGYITSGGKKIYLSADTVKEINAMINRAERNLLGIIKIK